MRPFQQFLRTDRIPPAARPNYHAEFKHYFLWVIFAGAIDMNLNGIVAKKTFGASDHLTTFIWAIPVLANILNVFWGVICRGRRRIPMMIVVSSGIVACVASIALVPRAWQPWAGWVFALQLAATFVLWSGLLTLRVSLWQANYPAAKRAQIAGRFQILRLLSMLAVPVSLGWLYDRAPDSYRFVYPAAALIGLISLIPLRRVRVKDEHAEIKSFRERQVAHGHESHHTLAGLWKGVAEALRIFRDDKPFRNYQVAQFLLGSANFFTEPILILVLTTELRLGYFHSTLIMTLVRAFVMLLTTATWSRFFDRVGIFRFRVYNSAFWCVSYALVATAMIILVTRDASWSPVVIGLIVTSRVVSGLGAAGGMLAWPLGHLAFAREHQANLYLGLHVALTGVRGLIMPQVAQAARAAYGNLVVITAVVLATTAHVLFRRMKHHDRRLDASRAANPDDGADTPEPPPTRG